MNLHLRTKNTSTASLPTILMWTKGYQDKLIATKHRCSQCFAASFQSWWMAPPASGRRGKICRNLGNFSIWGKKHQFKVSFEFTLRSIHWNVQFDHMRYFNAHFWWWPFIQHNYGTPPSADRLVPPPSHCLSVGSQVLSNRAACWAKARVSSTGNSSKRNQGWWNLRMENMEKQLVGLMLWHLSLLISLRKPDKGWPKLFHANEVRLGVWGVGVACGA